MLNTKDMSAGSGKTRPVITVGNQKVKLIKLLLIKHHMIKIHIMLYYM